MKEINDELLKNICKMFSRKCIDLFKSDFYVILYKDEILNLNGVITFKNIEKAKRAFYNAFRWRLVNEYCTHHYGVDWHLIKRDESSTDVWKTVKTKLFSENIIKFVSLKEYLNEQSKSSETLY
jgi:hypothetical protein